MSDGSRRLLLILAPFDRRACAFAFVLGAATAACAPAPEGPTPIIDAHLHGGPGTRIAEAPAMLRQMDEDGVIVAALSIHDSAGAAWADRAPDRFLVGPSFPCPTVLFPGMAPCFAEGEGWPELDWLRAQYEGGRLEIMGEVLYVYEGIPPTHERLAPYWALAAELDIPVGVHAGRGPPPEGRAPGCCPGFDADVADPSLLAPVLARHPGLRIWLMHAGEAYLDETIALMKAHPDVYADMSIVNSLAPPVAHEQALRRFRDEGLIDRIMFGTDNMPVPDIVARIEAVPFLTAEERRGIYCGNAMRFFRLDAGVCEAPTTPSAPSARG